MPFTTLSHTLKDGNLIVFFDMEATQFSHKAIALGLIAYEKKPGDLLFDMEKKIEYHSYIKQSDDIGPVVEEMTGITKDVLAKEGKDFHTVVLEITKLLRPYKKKYVSYGSMDIKILGCSINPKDETEENFYRNITKNYLDFHTYISRRICNEKGQSYSIASLMNLYGIENEGRYHDPLTDAVDLMKIYQAYITNIDRDIQLYLEHYSRNPYTNSINKQLTLKVLDEGQANKEDLISLLRNNL